jgi:hypothetical protein
VLFNHGTVEALYMRWLNSDRWKVGIALAGMLLLLVLMARIPVSAVGAYEGASGLATSVTDTAQATPTEDATVTALNKEKLAQEVQQLKNQNAPDLFAWLRTNASILLVVGGGLFGLWRWLVDRRDAQDKERKERRDAQDKELKDRAAERERRDEERFQSAVTGLGNEKEGARIGAAILLRTFLRPGYERFYTQIFELVTANLRLPRTPHPPEDPTAPLPLTALSQALIVAFMEAFPLARDQERKKIHALSAIGILLDNGFLWYADLKGVWMAQASLRKTDLTKADLSGANLYEANLSGAYLWETNLRQANLWAANLCKSDLRGTDLSGAFLTEANLSGASLYSKVNLSGAVLSRANLSGARLHDVNLSGAVLSRANLSGANLEVALSLKDTDLRGVKGLTKEQLEAYKARGAIIDEDSTMSSSQLPVSPSTPSQSNDVQTPSAPSAQVKTPSSDTEGSGVASSQQGSEP